MREGYTNMWMQCYQARRQSRKENRRSGLATARNALVKNSAVGEEARLPNSVADISNRQSAASRMS